MQEEIRDHLERRRQQLIADGIDPAEAATEARRAFGNVDARARAAARRLGLPSARQPDAGRPLRRANPAARARDSRRSRSCRCRSASARRRPSSTSPTPCCSGRSASAIPARFATSAPSIGHRRRDAQEGRVRRRSCRDRGDAPAGADFADLIAFRTVDDVAWRPAGGDAHLVRAELVSPDYFAVLGVPAAGRPAARRRRSRTISGSGRDQRPVVAKRAWPPTRGRRPERHDQRRAGDHRRRRQRLPRTDGRAAGRRVRAARCDRARWNRSPRAPWRAW